MKYCESIENMKGKVSCELGSRKNYIPTYFTSKLNGPEGVFETPCAGGLSAYSRGIDSTSTHPCGGFTGMHNEVLVCGDSKLEIFQNAMEYWTITMKDKENATQWDGQDRYTSEYSAKLGALGDMEYGCANNLTITTNDYDTSLYMTGVNHYGSARGEAGMNMVERIINGTATKTSGR